MARVIGTRHGNHFVPIAVCEHCGIVVSPDRDGCPNDDRAPLSGGGHPLREYIRADVAVANESGRIAERTVQEIALGSVEAAIACLEAAKAGLRR